MQKKCYYTEVQTMDGYSYYFSTKPIKGFDVQTLKLSPDDMQQFAGIIARQSKCWTQVYDGKRYLVYLNGNIIFDNRRTH